jgi:undecaprenyl diphosphate synthase
MASKESIDLSRLPRHVAIIMDGNGRWAKKKGNQRIFGHRYGVAAVKETIEAAAEIGVGYVTLYAFSTENWSRPKTEVDALMTLLVTTLGNELDSLIKNNVRLMAIGDIDSLPGIVARNLQQSIDKTSTNTGLVLVLALSYSGRWEITRSVKQIALDVASGKLSPDDIDEKLISSRLQTSNIPDPELLIRTSGEYRVSNFLLWQLAYTEFYFTDTLWPDFRKEHFFDAVYDFQQRERRFGKTSEQLS